MPDIDIDFADTRRDEVLAYAREKYGDDHVARIITFGTMAARAAIRDAGRAMGYSYAFCDQIAKLIPFNPTQGMKEGWLDECLRKVAELKALYDANPDAKKLIDTARHLEGVARHASVHACATVIAKEPLMERVPLQFAPQDKDITITQFEMHAVEDLGLLKIDFLGLKNLTIIENAVHLIKELTGDAIDITKIPLDDEKTFALLQKADTTGVFQFESSGMRRYMKDIKPTGLEDLIALVALFPSGAARTDPLVHQAEARPGKDRLSPSCHQRDAGIDLRHFGVSRTGDGHGDQAGRLYARRRISARQIRRAKRSRHSLMSKKKNSSTVVPRTISPPKIANEVWGLIEPFARYGFNKAHSACYALIGYQTAYLKAHYPEEFMAALLNAEVSDIERISFLIQEAKQSGLSILPPDINKSFVTFTPEGEKIRFGLEAVKNVGTEITKAIIEERTQRGPFKTFEDVLTRIQHKDLNKKSIESLVKAGAFDSLGIERNQALQNMDDILRFANAARKSGGAPSGSSLFGDTMPAAALKLKPAPPATNAEKLAWEKELIGFYLSEHPLTAYAEKLKNAGSRPIAELMSMKNEKLIVRTAGVVTKLRKIVTKNGQPMIFATIEDSSQKPLEVVVFNSVLEKTASAWAENVPVIVQGRISPRDGEMKFICDNAKRLS